MTNLERARVAERCLAHFAFLTGVDTAEDAVTDLIADIGHFCDREELSFLQLVALAIGHCHLERAEADSLDALPEVTITINESTTHATH